MTREEFLAEYPKYIDNYVPSEQVLRHIGEITLVMIIGPSGAGKTTLINKSGWAFVPSDTTRESRPGERDGVDMIFRKDYEQVIRDVKDGQFVQIVLGAEGDLYATKDTSYPESGIAILPVMADVVPIFRRLGFKNTISAFVTPPDYTEWMRRMRTHPISQEQLAKRLKEAERSFDFALSDPAVQFVLNDDINQAVKRLQQVANQEKPADEAQARQAAETILQKLLEA